MEEHFNSYLFSVNYRSERIEQARFKTGSSIAVCAFHISIFVPTCAEKE